VRRQVSRGIAAGCSFSPRRAFRRLGTAATVCFFIVSSEGAGRFSPLLVGSLRCLILCCAAEKLFFFFCVSPSISFCSSFRKSFGFFVPDPPCPLSVLGLLWRPFYLPPSLCICRSFFPGSRLRLAAFFPVPDRRPMIAPFATSACTPGKFFPGQGRILSCRPALGFFVTVPARRRLTRGARDPFILFFVRRMFFFPPCFCVPPRPESALFRPSITLSGVPQASFPRAGIPTVSSMPRVASTQSLPLPSRTICLAWLPFSSPFVSPQRSRPRISTWSIHSSSRFLVCFSV